MTRRIDGGWGLEQKPQREMILETAVACRRELDGGRSSREFKSNRVMKGVVMVEARWNGEVIAASDACVAVEGNQYFPAEAVEQALLRASDTTTICPWKGTAHYYDVVVGDRVNKDAAWYYPEPKPAAAQIRDRIAFWKGVEVRA